MNDTPPDVEAVYHRLVMSRSPADRVAMASDMFTFAKECIAAGLRAEGVTDPVELQVGVFLRLHGDLPAHVRDAVVARIRSGD